MRGERSTLRLEVAQMLPAQWFGGTQTVFDQLPEVRLYQAILMDAIWTLDRYRKVMLPGEDIPGPVRDVIEWLQDPEGRIRRYAVTYGAALSVGFPAMDPEVVTTRLMALVGFGPVVTLGKLRRRLVRGLPTSVARCRMKVYRPQVGRGHRVPREEEEEACHG